MARNKYPEETVNLILDVSLRLFLEKGYDDTSVQDIIDRLGGLSKGAIYHHFKSKETILLAVYDRMNESASRTMQKIIDNPDLNGRDKLRQMFNASWKNSEHMEFMASMPDLLENPRMLAMSMSATMNYIVPNFVLPVIEEGIEDGSIRAKYPRESADIIMLLSNIWLNPLIYPMDEESIKNKFEIFTDILSVLGIELQYDGAREYVRRVKDKKGRFGKK